MKKILYGFKHETLEAKIKWMLSLSLVERYSMGLDFAELMSLAGKDKDGRNARKAFRTVQVIKKK